MGKSLDARDEKANKFLWVVSLKELHFLSSSFATSLLGEREWARQTEGQNFGDYIYSF
jgi:anti-anti-sigma regulatory factor